MNKYALIMIISAFLASISQILLKLSTQDEHITELSVYFNFKVISAYIILGFTLLMNIYAFTNLEYRYGAVLTSLSYIITMIFSRFILKEKIGWRCFLGNLMILIGIFAYTFGE